MREHDPAIGRERRPVTGAVEAAGSGGDLEQAAEVCTRARDGEGGAVLLGDEANELRGSEALGATARQLLGRRYRYPLAVVGDELARRGLAWSR